MSMFVLLKTNIANQNSTCAYFYHLIWTRVEIFKDTSIRLAPVTKNEAETMIRELKAYPLPAGARGRGPSDCQALMDVVCRVSALLAACPGITEIDLNPVIVHPEGQGVSIVDARVFFQ